jgi:glycerol-3-phosphate acyltransferase PlsY
MNPPVSLGWAGFIIFGYLLGSIPTAYLAGKWIKHIDVRRYGSGTVSGSMVWEHVASWAILPVGIFDMAKAATPAWLALAVGLGDGAAAAAGLAAAVGHNWPIYLGFTGGRGLSTFLGIWLVLYPLAFPWLLGWLALGWVLGDSAPLGLLGMISLPLFAHWMNGPAIVIPLCGGMLLITLAKRVEANRRPLPEEREERRKVILYRLLLDRDILPHKAWVRREPTRHEPGESSPTSDGA